MCKINNNDENQRLRRQSEPHQPRTIWDIPVNIQQAQTENNRTRPLISKLEIRNILRTANSFHELSFLTAIDNDWSISSFETATKADSSESD